MRKCVIASPNTVVDKCNFCQEVCATVIETKSEPIGGVAKVVKIDKSKFGKRKYHCGRMVDGVWVSGGIERDGKKCFLVSVEDRSAATLIPIIKQYILPGTKIMSNSWKSYDKLEEGYIHGTFNHTEMSL
uniref:ISXO2-like transposase domain-containing protein n=1 Tax=Amphimedon queenslandica TaxID=400682 RepID=A0A1X7UN54_AMPQE